MGGSSRRRSHVGLAQGRTSDAKPGSILRAGGQGNVSHGTRACLALKSHRSASPHLTAWGWIEKSREQPHAPLNYLPSSVRAAGDTDHRNQSASFSSGFRGIVAMAKGVLVANRSTVSGCPAMHSTAAFAAHRWRSARMPASSPSPATKGSVHQ
jgi:hypothetical protein